MPMASMKNTIRAREMDNFQKKNVMVTISMFCAVNITNSSNKPTPSMNFVCCMVFVFVMMTVYVGVCVSIDELARV